MPAAPRPLVSMRAKLRIVTSSAPAKMPSARSPVVVRCPKLRTCSPVCSRRERVFVEAGREEVLEIDDCHARSPAMQIEADYTKRKSPAFKVLSCTFSRVSLSV